MRVGLDVFTDLSIVKESMQGQKMDPSSTITKGWHELDPGALFLGKRGGGFVILMCILNRNFLGCVGGGKFS